MASVESAYDAAIAQSMGWRTFQVVVPDQPTLGSSVECPSEKGVQCADCLLCSGAHRASALIVAAAHMTRPNGDANPWATYDLGLAVSLLTVQAHVMDLHVHQMGGINKDAVSTLLHLPEDVQPVVVLAVGTLGNPEQLHEGPLRDREMSVRERKPLEEIVLVGLETD